MRKILIPTDFSENAMNALIYAINLFKYEVSEFYIMHAYQDDIYSDEELLASETLDRVSLMTSKKTEEQLQKIKSDILNISPNPRHTFHSCAANNMLLDETDRLVDAENIDLVVMGTKGKTNNTKVTFGSNTLQIIKYMQCPVLAIPEGHAYIKPKHILFPTNFMIPYKRRELKLLCEIAAPYRAIIDVIYISKSNTLSRRQQENKGFMKDELCKNRVNFKTENSKHLINSVYKYIREQHIDMLVMVNTEHSFLENIIFQSPLDELSLNLDIPFLALQNIKRK
ncbi:universal stress protein [Algibacter mikhailovii]|uniref:universal stress protein n=1 Tax=Algibacter mikhailovii TaxID=425498 RepID=UPI00249514EC|nr:universal stress protein [Algibacter mikhailovii]